MDFLPVALGNTLIYPVSPIDHKLPQGKRNYDTVHTSIGHKISISQDLSVEYSFTRVQFWIS